MTARPLAAFTLAPASPVSARSGTRTATEGANAAPVSEAAAPPSPSATAGRSPRRSAAIPHGSSETVIPALALPSTTPTLAMPRS
jgi:hypothetical protein